MTTEILICTTLRRMHGVEHVLLPSMPDVSYLIGVQGGETPPPMPEAWKRPDVRMVWMERTGLSRNRNLVLDHAQGDLLVIADDDNPLSPQTIQGLSVDFETHPRWDIIQYRCEGSGKSFPPAWVSSCELVLRRSTAGRMRFDERFGLGSDHLASGEEEVFVYEALKSGLQLGQLDKFLCRVEGPTTGQQFPDNPRVQRSKGAVFAITHGRRRALYKCVREAFGWMVRRGANPLPMLNNMLWGIRYVSK